MGSHYETKILSSKSRSLPLKVVYDDLEVDSPNIVVLRVGNSGKAEIHGDDFDGPVRIEFNESRLLAASVSRKLDESINIDIVRDGDKSVSFTPRLLNVGEWVELQFVTDGLLEVPKVHARVAGQNGGSLDVTQARKKVWQPLNWVGLAVASFSPLASSLILGKDWQGLGLGVAIAGFALFAVASAQISFNQGWKKTKRRSRTEPASESESDTASV